MVKENISVGWNTNQMAQKVAFDIPDGSYVNLGIGLPELIATYIPEGREVIYHTENGLLGMCSLSNENQIDYELINAGKKPVSIIPGACYFHHADSFAMIRSGHIDICVLGGFQVSEEGDLANWSTGEQFAVPAVGGAMDLVSGVKTIFVIMQHTSKTGESKIVKKCTYPLTGKKVVNRIYTNLAIIDVTEKGLVVKELAPGVTFEYLQQNTAAKLHQ